ncbi:MAG TPA: hypothetical protein DCZ84_00110 [Candidatus Vogelbacteria bacterium]|uniref:Uncharacterized protein n=1 Tax=Candidatus Vogelbacteria bacterium RIFOXYD1_FULL_51_18 TaxID=1802440 RepID=A0A1G2QIU2_9BACT|nr:MAG: hypothetical protein UY66_C0012G0015 [Parcubacteria group bacterium GW2011_GWC1_51_35]KKW24290.1 MAG: hypothetical protein UY68_C0012G0031 [Parcubacteria group bacterium GW2011_GWF2_52_12]KKW26084.1 MAG: hypothetical protein UY69_C0038G0002 [Parcubacteria group bacterium GW2011_GWF1_52_5]KKW34643.1 MAG: hypothetical protein UY80_C0012G0007 [Parcubacteria group bacterium GW2011_GWB1_53_43]KKW38195.1 MAG: hypothetical protein UY88_C0018G0005 [Parcubacteria group bacterium GW2011_GWA1_54_8
MNKTIWIVVGIVILIAFGLYFYMAGSGSPAEIPGTVGSTPTSLNQLAALGTPQKCTFADGAADVRSEGVVYVSGGSVRADFASAEGTNTATQGHMIQSGGEVYTWVDGMTQGYRIAASQAGSATGTAQALNPDKSVDYRCEPWSPDASAFTPPANISFVSMADIQSQIRIPVDVPLGQ